MRGWTEIQLEDALEVLIDYRGKSPKKSETGIPVISAKVVKSGRILDGIEQTIAPDYYVEWMRRGVPQAGDVVMTTEGPLGEVARLDETSAQYALGQRIVTMRGREGVLDNGFLKYLLMSSGIQERLQSRATGSTVAGISQKSLRSLPLPLAPFAEQREIASILGALVFRVRHLLPISPDLVERIERAALPDENVLGGLAPDEGLRLGVVQQ
ncbi:restriction endonuclease subunit S, partial [Marivita sp.]|uniref:restriction endonuclease subunit S n=1 Tax=Marivita sp. TaxID=2003365 RepID=UPI00261B2781